MALSARNQLMGTVKAINKNAVTAEVVVELPGGQEMVAVITAASAERLGAEVGKEITVVVKATDVMLSNG